MNLTRSLASLSVFSVVIFVAVSCSKTEDLPEPARYSLENIEQLELGRVLFYEKALSINNAVSCGSCHKQVNAFADNTAFSTGFESGKTTRNTPPIQNLNSGFFEGDEFSGQALFWDGRTRNLNELVIAPTQNHIEMGMRSADDLVSRLRGKPYYATLFQNRFGSEEITIEKVSIALTSFIRQFESINSKFDMSFFFNSLDDLSVLESQGFQLFTGKYNCMSCHDVLSNSGYSEPTGEEFVNIGLNVDYADKGRAAVTGNEADNGKFRIPNLRNIALTAPYMHDGRFSTLEEVIGHYSEDLQPNINLDSRLRESTGEPLKMNISESETVALVAFLNTLTDQNLPHDKRLSDPFIK
ncbi:c-type cytochrome [Cryomorpha ignava]|uniref:C-type cytochrome n=1 Tax=Cryomorpha ignava TaxID=101383 RepID=A0A7K3WTC4_9FLAO|nr:cytochrome c peroxidase [Cryomorpha ignava]NEN24937.1 c-type cytochrome [Cryomorpha ignava]